MIRIHIDIHLYSVIMCPLGLCYRDRDNNDSLYSVLSVITTSLLHRLLWSHTSKPLVLWSCLTLLSSHLDIPLSICRLDCRSAGMDQSLGWQREEMSVIQSSFSRKKTNRNKRTWIWRREWQGKQRKEIVCTPTYLVKGTLTCTQEIYRVGWDTEKGGETDHPSNNTRPPGILVIFVFNVLEIDDCCSRDHLNTRRETRENNRQQIS